MNGRAMIARYLTHPQVRIDPERPVSEWGLSAEGEARTRALSDSGALAGTTRIISSAETKAVETAALLAPGLGLKVEIREAMHENDRSSTGYLPPTEFEAMADRFFAEPMQGICGWERAIDAQARIVDEVETCLAGHGGGDILFVGHGAVGTLLWCALSNERIDRRHDQRAGGGCFFTFTLAGKKPLDAWQPLEKLIENHSNRSKRDQGRL